MSFCPVCGAMDRAVEPQCQRVARYYGYSSEAIAELVRRGSSIAVPFFETRRLFFLLAQQQRRPLARRMIEAVERGGGAGQLEEHGNQVRVLPFAAPEHPEVREVFIKEDVSKTMVIYRHDDAIEHFGSEERAVLFSEVAQQFFGLGQEVPETASGLSAAGTKYVVSAGLPRDRFLSLEEGDRPRLLGLWHEGVLPRLAILDFVLGQNDRNVRNVLLSRGSPAVIGLIDNDDAFGPHERLIDPFAYLALLRDERGALHFGELGHWFEGLSLPDLVAFLSRRALPAEIVGALCARFVFAAALVNQGAPLQSFMSAAFSGRRPGPEALPGRPWVDFRALVSEREDGIHYRNLLGARLGDRCHLWSFEGRLLDEGPCLVRQEPIADPGDGPSLLSSQVALAGGEGFSNIVRRRFFVQGQTVRIVEIRHDPTGWHVLVRRGPLGHYADKQRERFFSFSSAAEAVARADQLEADLTASGAQDLRTRLAMLKTEGVQCGFF